MTMQSIRDRYNVPAKRGMTAFSVYCGKCRILSAQKGTHRLRVRSGYGIDHVVHPLEIDYLVDGQWVKGEDLTKKYNERITRFSEAINVTVDRK